MTLTKTHDVEATTAQIAALASAGLRDRPRRRAEARGRRGAAADRPLLADPGDRRHPLQREPRAEGDRGAASRPCASTPATSAAPTRSRWSCKAAKQGRHPDAHRRELRLAAEASRRRSRSSDQAEALVEAALEEVRLLESLDYYDFKISVKSSHVPTMIRAYRMLSEQGAVSAAPRRHRGGHAVLRLDQVRGRHGRAARRRDRRHDARLAHRRPGRRGQDGVRDPQGARAARARAGDDRVPELRPRQRRRADARREGRGAARARIRSTSRSRCSAAPSTGPARRATPTSGSPAAATSASSTRTAAC